MLVCCFLLQPSPEYEQSFGMYSVLLPIRTDATAVKAMRKYYGRVLNAIEIHTSGFSRRLHEKVLIS